MDSGYGYTGKTTNRHRDVIGSQVQAENEDRWGEMPGEVVAFNTEKQTITVKPLYKKRLNGVATDLPELEEVPVRFPRMGGFVITTPVKKGDRVTLRPQMRNTEAYHEEDGAFTANDTRSNNLSDMEAYLDGGESLSKPIPKFNSRNMELRSEDGQFAMEMSEDGKFRMRGAMGNWYDIVAQVVELLGQDGLAVQYGSSAGTGHELQFKAQYAELGAKLRGMAL